MPTNKEAARVLAHPNGQRCFTACRAFWQGFLQDLRGDAGPAGAGGDGGIAHGHRTSPPDLLRRYTMDKNKQNATSVLEELEAFYAASEAALQEARASGTERERLYRLGQRDAALQAIKIVKAWFAADDA